MRIRKQWKVSASRLVPAFRQRESVKSLDGLFGFYSFGSLGSVANEPPFKTEFMLGARIDRLGRANRSLRLKNPFKASTYALTCVTFWTERYSTALPRVFNRTRNLISDTKSPFP